MKFNLNQSSVGITARLSGIIAKFLVVVLLESWLATGEFAHYVLLLSIVNIAATTTRFGADNYIFRVATKKNEKTLICALGETYNLASIKLFLLFFCAFIWWIYRGGLEAIVLLGSILSLNILHYLVLVTRARGAILKSIVIYEVLPSIIFLSILLISGAVDPVIIIGIQYFIFAVIAVPIVYKEIDLYFHASAVQALWSLFPKRESFRKIYHFGLINIFNSLAVWGDVLLITLLFEAQISAAYFLLTRIFEVFNRLAVLPLYKSYNYIGSIYEKEKYVSYAEFLKQKINLTMYLSTLIVGSSIALIALSYLSLPVMDALSEVSLILQFCFLASLVICSLSSTVESFCLVSGNERIVFTNSVRITLIRYGLVILLLQLFDLLILHVLGVFALITVIGRALLICSFKGQ